MKSPDIVIAEFKARRSIDRQADRRKTFGRGFEIISLWAACVLCFVWLAKTGEMATSPLPVILAGFITDSLRSDGSSRSRG